MPECPAGSAFTELNEGELKDAVCGAVFEFDSGCICSNWTGTLTRPTTLTRTFVIGQQDGVTPAQGVLDVQRF
jgi:hypothetical protein